ncbi:MAG: substrate-binding domain-containing protein, partial [Treponema sp.]|nr:substrate-binding domain-containing protein [Treponema sp.]
MRNSRILGAAIVALLFLSANQAFARGSADSGRRIILATTTSTYDSGLLGFILPAFTADTGWNVDVISVGTGAALQLGRDGQADVLLVHAMAQELQFVAEGHGLERHDVMYNDFIIVGPAGRVAHNANAAHTFREIARMNLPFVSRGDNSGTHVKEME